MIKLENLLKIYHSKGGDDVVAINNVSLELPDSGIITFLGESGSGKSTLLNAIGGLDSFKGSIDYGDFVSYGYKMRHIDKYRSQNIGYVFQDYDLLLEETVYDNLRFALEIIGIYDPAETDNRIKNALTAVDMYKFRKKKAKALSGGQQQRVAIARALIKKCKILIADEPTGNIDSSNTIAIMNILKSISTDTLVLLVTHEHDIAEYYSDGIVRIKDGAASDIEYDLGEKELRGKETNAVYLKDMECKSMSGDAGVIKFYTNDDKKIDITVICKNDTLYIQSDDKIQIASQSNLKIIDAHKSDSITDFKTDFSYVDLSYSNVKGIKRHNPIRTIATTFKSVFSVKKKMKFFYLALALVGMLLGFGVSALVNYISVDSSDFSYNNNYYTIYSDDSIYSYSYEDNNIIRDLADKGFIKVAFRMGSAYLKLNNRLTFYMSTSSTLYSTVFKFNEDVSLYKGSNPEENEIVVSRDVADKILKVFPQYSSYEEIFGINLFDIPVTVSGISEGDQNMIYLPSDLYYDYDAGILNRNPYYYYNYDIRVASNEIDLNGRPLYTVSEGRNVNVDSADYEILIPDNSEYSKYEIGDTINLENNSFTVVGKTTHKYNPLAFISNRYSNKYQEISNNYSTYMRGISSKRYEIIEGRDIERDDEIIINAYTNKRVGDIINGKYKVVGRYTGDQNAVNITARGTDLANILNESDFAGVCFSFADKGEALAYCREKEYNVDTMYRTQYMQQLRVRQMQMGIFAAVFLSLTIVCFLFIYFIMRSRMITDIREIGILRSLGASRLIVSGKYMRESSMLVLCTLMIGYIAALMLYSFTESFINRILGGIFFFSNLLYYILFGIIIFIVASFFGIIPIITLLLKTPKEIKNKYDI